MDTKIVSISGQEVTVPAKPWYTSKSIWTGIVFVLVGVFSYLSSRYPTNGVIETAGGILVIINRYFTTSAIQ